MKKRLLFLTAVIISLFVHSVYSQTNDTYIKEIKNEREAKDQLMSDAATSPLTADEIKSFDSLSYFPVDKKFMIEGQLNATESQEKVSLNTTDGGKKELMRYGTINFTFDGKPYSLAVFRNANLPEFGDNSQQLFIPFTDLTTDEETSPDGRYLPVSIADGETRVTLDFNKAMNPFSAYNDQYSSVLAPPENRLMFSVVSGERKYEHR